MSLNSRDNKKKSIPAPREDFVRVLKNAKAGQIVSLPSLGQLPDLHGDGDPQKAFLITQQMLDVWSTISENYPHRRERNRICAGEWNT
ncbi:hypothetical protein BGZ76_005621 [Entomortierella beljakovae]|nr:hypothetical protein BGZ76_005621 [Entomortierella beljakovae]